LALLCGKHIQRAPCTSPKALHIRGQRLIGRHFGLLQRANHLNALLHRKVLLANLEFKLLASLFQLLLGGQSDPERRRIAPTLIRVESLDDPLMQEELFGPLLPVLRVSGLDDAIERINQRPKPLALYLFSKQRDAQEQILQRTSSGGVCFNDVVMHVGVPELPFGGVGSSGMGSYHGEAGFRTFSHERSVLRRPFSLDLPFRYPPYAGKLPLIRRLLG
jgi:aldehyde dehydrogenase (NAD+)